MKTISKSSKLKNVCYDIRGQIAAEAKRLEDEGVTHILTMPWPFYPNDKVDELTQKSDAIKRFADDVIAKM